MGLADIDLSIEDLDQAMLDSGNPYLDQATEGMALMARLIALESSNLGKPQRQNLERLHGLIHQDFVVLSARDSYPAEARAFRDLLALEDSLKDLSYFPDLANKNIIGVGGGFSAGKSRFLNTLVGDDLLPESLEPTTAIPSFLSGGGDAIIALNVFNKKVELDLAALQAISHAFLNHYEALIGQKVGFSHVIKLLMIHRPGFAWENLAFLDTPGYSKADAGSAGQTDEAIALKQLTEADHVLWLINARNGSIRRDDLEFLRNLGHARPIFFVMTQADLVGESGIRAILDSTAQAIKDAGIPSAGLMAWAAPLGEPHGRKVAGDDVFAWLDHLDALPKYTSKRKGCSRVLDAYIAHNKSALVTNRKLLAALNEALPLVQSLADNRLQTLRDEVGKLREEQKQLESLLDEFAELKQQMLESITKIVGELALDEEDRPLDELLLTCERKSLPRPMQVEEAFELQVTCVSTVLRRVFISLSGDETQKMGSLPFSRVRDELNIEPLEIVKGARLHGEVRCVDEHNAVVAITHLQDGRSGR